MRRLAQFIRDRIQKPQEVEVGIWSCLILYSTVELDGGGKLPRERLPVREERGMGNLDLQTSKLGHVHSQRSFRSFTDSVVR